MSVNYYCQQLSAPTRCFYDIDGITPNQHILWILDESKGYYLTLGQIVELRMNYKLDASLYTMREGKYDPNGPTREYNHIWILHEKNVTTDDIHNKLASINVEVEPGVCHVPYRKITFTN